jgi:hypothetical protein
MSALGRDGGEPLSSNGAATIRFEAAIPQFTVHDVVRTAEYHRDVLGFEIVGYWATPPVFAIVRRDQVEVFFNRTDQPSVGRGRAQGAYDAYLHVVGVEALAAERRARGADVVEGRIVRIYGQLELVIRDCTGLVLAFGEHTSRPERRLIED